MVSLPQQVFSVWISKIVFTRIGVTTFPNIQRFVEILLVEDNPADARLATLALKGSIYPHHLSIAEDGEAAMEFLKKRGTYAQSKTPDIILLDWNLPRKNGSEVLQEIKSDQSLMSIPVIVMTGYNSEQTISEAYELGANFFIPKPMNLDRFAHVMEYVASVWGHKPFPQED